MPLRAANEQEMRGKWNVECIRAVANDAERFLSEPQICQLEALSIRLQDFEDGELTTDLDLRKCSGTIWRLRDRGGSFGVQEPSLLFSPRRAHHQIVVLGCVPGEITRATVWQMEYRLRRYCQSKVCQPSRLGA